MINPDPDILTPLPVVVTDPDGRRPRAVSLVLGRQAERMLLTEQLNDLPAQIQVLWVRSTLQLQMHLQVSDNPAQAAQKIKQKPGAYLSDRADPYAIEQLLRYSPSSPMRVPQAFRPCGFIYTAVLHDWPDDRDELRVTIEQAPGLRQTQFVQEVSSTDDIRKGMFLIVADDAPTRQGRMSDLTGPAETYDIEKTGQGRWFVLIGDRQTGRGPGLRAVPLAKPVQVFSPWGPQTIEIVSARSIFSEQEITALQEGTASDLLLNEVGVISRWVEDYLKLCDELTPQPGQTSSYANQRWAQALEDSFFVRLADSTKRYVESWR